MSTKPKYKNVFTWLSQAWYGKNQKDDNILDTLFIDQYDENDESIGSFEINWVSLGNDSSPELKIFDESCECLIRMPEILNLMTESNQKTMAIDDFVNKLLNLGYTDITERTYNNEIDKKRVSFELSAQKNGFSLKRTDSNKYKDHNLQISWQLLNDMNLNILSD
jgi:hypothetical protein